MKKTLIKRASDYARAHKIISTIVLVIIVIIGYYWYRSAVSANAAPQYVLSSVHNGSIIQTVTGTGQVSASNQTDIQSQVSGTIESINVSVGQSVSAGDLIATIDSSNAAISLANAKISYAKLTEPAKATDISNSLNNLNKSYSDGFNSASSVYLDLPAIMSGMKDLVYGQTGFLSNQQASYLSAPGQAMVQTTSKDYDAAVIQYQKSLNEFNSITRNSATSSIDASLADTYTTIQMVAKAVTDAQNAVTYITTTQPQYQTKTASTAAANVNSWASQANSDLANLVSSQNSITSNSNSYTTLVTGADQYDIQAAQLTLDQQQKNYSNYFIRAPYDGVIGRMPVNVYGQAGNGTTIATIVGTQMTASISLDEVDAAKVQVGQSATITFNAISGLNATGTVSEVDQIGTVVSGVVSYGVKIIINTQDSRIKPGMSINTVITTYEKDNVLIVPTSAIKTQNGGSYVQVFDPAIVTSAMAAANPGVGTSTYAFGSSTFRGSRGNQSTTTMALSSSTNLMNNSGFASSSFASTTFASSTLASSTRKFGGQTGGSGRTLTITTSSQPQQVTVVTGDSDDTNTEIVSGLTRGQFVVTRTISSGGTTATTAAPSLLSSLTGNRGGAGGGGAARITGGGGGGARPAGN